MYSYKQRLLQKCPLKIYRPPLAYGFEHNLSDNELHHIHVFKNKQEKLLTGVINKYQATVKLGDETAIFEEKKNVIGQITVHSCKLNLIYTYLEKKKVLIHYIYYIKSIISLV